MNELSTNHIRFARERGTLWFSDIHIYSEHPRVANRLPSSGSGRRWSWSYCAPWDSAAAASGSIRQVGRSAACRRCCPTQARPTLAAMRALRWVKTKEEIAVHRAAAELSDWGQARYRENIRPGGWCRSSTALWRRSSSRRRRSASRARMPSRAAGR